MHFAGLSQFKTLLINIHNRQSVDGFEAGGNQIRK